jgi:hypothetical protein
MDYPILWECIEQKYQVVKEKTPQLDWGFFMEPDFKNGFHRTDE